MARYYQNFTLTDIFNNKNLKGKIPLINYREKELEDGKISKRTNVKSIGKLVYDTSVSSARPFYKPLVHAKSGNIISLGGELVGDHDQAVEAVYNALLGQKSVMIWTVNNADMIRSALKEAENNKRKFGIDSKLYLRAKSMQEIEGMTKHQILALMSDIMDNIYFGDNFPKTQKKYRVREMLDEEARETMEFADTYSQRQKKWINKVGNW